MGKKKIILCDTNIFINLIRGDESVFRNLMNIGEKNIAYSIITRAEIFQGAKKSEVLRDKLLFEQWKPLHLSEDISKIFHGLIQNYSISHRIQIPDALIAATAISNDLQLYTFNKKDFDFIPEIRFYKSN